MKAFHAAVAADATGVDGGGISKVSSTDFDNRDVAGEDSEWDIDGSQFYWINDNIVVHMFRWTGKGTFQGHPVPSPVWTSTVWTNKGGKWTATFHQESVAMSPPPAAAPSSSGKK